MIYVTQVVVQMSTVRNQIPLSAAEAARRCGNIIGIRFKETTSPSLMHRQTYYKIRFRHLHFLSPMSKCERRFVTDRLKALGKILLR